MNGMHGRRRKQSQRGERNQQRLEDSHAFEHVQQRAGAEEEDGQRGRERLAGFG
jgi:hypothetical protein